jgi:hypothetical protein
MTETMTLENGPMSVPSGGIASFRMSDEDLANLDREQDEQLAEEVYGSEGISRFTEIASDMAGLGRYGDDVVVHAQTGELVIPKRILDESPEIRAVVYQALREQGIEDPEQYVVGSGSASINPNTGLAEYGFFKGIKKAFKQVVKVVKKIAPIVLPIAMTIMFPALGAYGAALGSGIGSLMQGGSIKDALKAAALSGLSSAAFSGVSNIGSEGGFTGGFTGSLANPGARFAQVGGQLKSGFSGQGFNFGQQFTGVPSTSATPENKGVFADDIANQTAPVSASDQLKADLSGYDPNDPAYFNKGAPTDTTPIIEQSNNLGPGRNTNLMNNQSGDYPGAASKDLLPADDRSFFQKSKDFMFGQQPTGADLATAQTDFSKSYAEGLKNSNPNMSAADVTTISNNAARQQVTLESLKPGYLRTFGPSAGLVLGATYLGGGFDTPEEEPVDILDRNSDGSVRTGQDVYRENEAKYKVGDLYSAPISYTTPNTPYQSYANINPYQSYANINPFTIPSIGTGNPFYRPSVQTAAQGGEIFPRRNGGIMPNEGIPGQDSVRAMLMPGEFVMTTDAVKGAGGIPNMYHMMSALERKGRMA